MQTSPQTSADIEDLHKLIQDKEQELALVRKELMRAEKLIHKIASFPGPHPLASTAQSAGMWQGCFDAVREMARSFVDRN